MLTLFCHSLTCSSHIHVVYADVIISETYLCYIQLFNVINIRILHTYLTKSVFLLIGIYYTIQTE